MTAPNAEVQAAMDRIAKTTRQAVLRALRSSTNDFALTGHWTPEPQRVAYLFGKAYWWNRDPDGRLTLQPAAWINPTGLRDQLAGRDRPDIVAPWPPTRTSTLNT